MQTKAQRQTKAEAALMYLNYPQYAELFGKMPEDDFDRLLPSSEAMLDRATYQRLQRVAFATQPLRTQDAVRRCLTQMVDLGLLADKAEAQPYQSTSNNGVSVSYKGKTSADYRREQSEAILTWLSGVKDVAGTPLLYAGMDGAMSMSETVAPERPVGEYATTAQLDAVNDDQKNIVIEQTFDSVADIAAWIYYNEKSMRMGTILRTLNDDPDFIASRDEASGEFVARPIPNIHATKIDMADGKTVQATIDALIARIEALEAK